MALDVLVGYIVLLAALAGVAYFVFASFVFGAGYQPTPRRAVREMLRLADVRPEDVVYDLGAGTGAIVFRAARSHGARVLGVEVEPIRFLVLRLRRWAGSGGNRIDLRWGNLFRLDFRPATVVTAFLWPGAMARLRPKFEAELGAGARVVSHCHPIPRMDPDRLRSGHRRLPLPMAGRPGRRGRPPAARQRLIRSGGWNARWTLRPWSRTSTRRRRRTGTFPPRS
ncbi:RNA methylase [mine drainage metagenome]|uniref:RNA methylase n=1 Tax=mine drainage metagenome TaxID=410659 RepID=T0ZCN7_9ZZZZ